MAYWVWLHIHRGTQIHTEQQQIAGQIPFFFYTLQPTHTKAHRHGLASFNRYTPIWGINSEATDSYRLRWTHTNTLTHTCILPSHSASRTQLCYSVTLCISFDRQLSAVTPADLWLHVDWLGREGKGYNTHHHFSRSLSVFLSHSYTHTHTHIFCAGG